MMFGSSPKGLSWCTCRLPALAALHGHAELVRKIMGELIASLDPSRLSHSISILGNLAAMLSPPEKSPVWLDQSSAAALVRTLKAIPPRMLDADVAVPLVVALMRYEVPLRSEVRRPQRRRLFRVGRQMPNSS